MRSHSLVRWRCFHFSFLKMSGISIDQPVKSVRWSIFTEQRNLLRDTSRELISRVVVTKDVKEIFKLWSFRHENQMAIIMPNCGEDDALFLGMPDPRHLRSRIVQSDIEVRLVCNSAYCPNRVDLKPKAIPSRLSRLTEHCQLLLPIVVTATIAAGVR